MASPPLGSSSTTFGGARASEGDPLLPSFVRSDNNNKGKIPPNNKEGGKGGTTTTRTLRMTTFFSTLLAAALVFFSGVLVGQSNISDDNVNVGLHRWEDAAPWRHHHHHH